MDGIGQFLPGILPPQRPDVLLPGGYLTLVQSSPLVSTDQASKTVVYYTPARHGYFPVVRNGIMRPVYFGDEDLALALGTMHTANTIFDVYGVDLGNGRGRIVTGPAWTTSTAGSGFRGLGPGTSELARAGGLLVNRWGIPGLAADGGSYIPPKEGTYLGSISIDGSAGQVSCHITFGQNRRWGIWNAYNQARIFLKAGDSTGSWTYNTATFRPSNNTDNNSVFAFVGMATRVRAEFKAHHSNNTAAVAMAIGIGVNSTTAASGLLARRIGLGASFTDFGTMVGPATYEGYVATGVTKFTSLEQSSSGGSATFFGTEGYMLLSAEYWG